MSEIKLSDYELGEVIGKGAFGSVFKAFKWSTGETVAIKQIATNDNKSETNNLMLEINLLKNLNHQNIVQYRGFINTSDHLFIILEYCENGSLYNVAKKFGQFPEPLISLYILQILHGLLYLHDQGVIHRDIKASNILLDKTGAVRLADFGVSTRVGVGPIDSSVVGSPYWMAPEVVEQAGATSASDIWSLGALVIELMTGKPPYSFLQPMAALFRIVNDDCPPIPESASPVSRDFLFQCFQKESHLRVGARKLLRHPWMLSAKRQVDKTKRDQLPRPSTPSSRNRMDSRPGISYDDTVSKVKEWNQALESGPIEAANRSKAARVRKLNRRRSLELISFLQSQPADVAQAIDFVSPIPSAIIKTFDSSEFSSVVDSKSSSSSQGNEREDDNWDADFEDTVPLSKITNSLELNILEDSTEAIEEEDDQDNSATIRPSSILSQTLQSSPIVPVLEDYSDLVGEDDADPFKGRVAHLRQYNIAKKRILHPNDISESFRTNSPNHSISISSPSAITAGSPSADALDAPFEAEEDWSDVFHHDDQSGLILQLNTIISNKSWDRDEASDEDDPFANIEEDDFDSANINNDLIRDKRARHLSRIASLIEELSEKDEANLRGTALELTEMLEDSYEGRLQFVKSHGLLVVLEILEVSRRSREILAVLLRIINLIVGDNSVALEKILLIGACPIITSFAAHTYSREIRLESALFIRSLCRTSLLTLQVFISCRGLSVLVGMMEENYADRKDLIWLAIDGICRVLDLEGPTPRNDFLRIFAAEGLIESLSIALLATIEDVDDLARSAKTKIVHLLLLFSQSDKRVKAKMITREIVARLVKASELLGHDDLPFLLKTIKSLTMVSDALPVLQAAGTIEALIRTYSPSSFSERRLESEIQSPVINSLFNLLRLSKDRQHVAAVSGLIPLLLTITSTPSPLKQFALPMLCDFAHTGRGCRELLWQQGGLQFYVGLLTERSWSGGALEAIAVWLQDDTQRIENILVERMNFHQLLKVFLSFPISDLDNILQPLNKILRNSRLLSRLFSQESSFYIRVNEGLLKSSQAIVRLGLLKLIKLVYETTIPSLRPSSTPFSPAPNASSPVPGSKPGRSASAISRAEHSDRAKKQSTLLGELVTTMDRLAMDDPAILARGMARELSREFAKLKVLRSTSSLSNKREEVTIRDNGRTRNSADSTVGGGNSNHSKRRSSVKKSS